VVVVSCYQHNELGEWNDLARQWDVEMEFSKVIIKGSVIGSIHKEWLVWTNGDWNVNSCYTALFQ
jgi:hypothetical protein